MCLHTVDFEETFEVGGGEVSVTFEVKYDYFENEFYFEDYTYETDCDFELSKDDKKEIEVSIENIINDYEPELDEPYDRKFEKYM